MALPRRALGPVTAATDFSNVNHNCDPPATLTSLTTALVQGNCYGSTDVLKGSNWVGIDPTGLCSDNANEPPPTSTTSTTPSSPCPRALPTCRSAEA